MPRPRRRNVIVIPLKLWLIPGRDDDLIDFFARLSPGQKAAAVMQAMRGGLEHMELEQTQSDEVDNILDHLGEMWV